MQIEILIYDGVADSGLALLMDVFTGANLLASRIDDHIASFNVQVSATQQRVRTAYGLSVDAQPAATGRGDRPDQTLIPSLGLITADDVVSKVTTSDVAASARRRHENGVAVATACSGTFFLAEAGLLDGRPATTSWWLGPAFRARYPDVQLDESQALVVTDSITTAGAALAHLDLGLSLVRRTSPVLADAVSDYLAVGDRPQQGELVRPSLLPTSEPVLIAFDRAIRDRLTEALDIGRLATQIGVSRRTLQRLTSSVLGMTPVGYIQQVRIERAVGLLRSTDLSVTAIAHAVGYQDATTLGTLIRRRRGRTPAQIRRRRAIDRPA